MKYNMKKGAHHFSVLMSLVGATLVSSCANESSPQQSYERSDYYNRGIGQYPGSPNENYSPSLVPDLENYRNLALNRATSQSSVHDYNLTSQLITDGIITDKLPQYLVLSTPKGALPRREMEWMLDEGPYSKNSFYGEDTFFQFSLNNYSKTANKIKLTGKLLYDEQKADGQYSIVCQVSENGNDWRDIANMSGDKFPGKSLSYHMNVTDPNKQTEKIPMSVRQLEETISFDNEETFSMFRVVLKMKGAYSWDFTAADFYNNDEQLDIKPSQYFNSSWMSESQNQEWVAVDLGSESEIDKVTLHWINKAIEGKIQISNNNEKWTDVAQLPNDDSAENSISLPSKKKCRYVRVLMDKSSNDNPYILSELEVFGTGGLVAKPYMVESDNKSELLLSGGDWKLLRASETNASGEDISKNGFDSDSWITATVPSTVLSSYVNIGALSNPNYADNQLTISESFFNSDFWYRDVFVLPENFKKEKLFLNFDGINWKAEIYLNGKNLGRIDGAFIRGKFDVTDIANVGENVLAVRIIKNLHIGSIKEKNKFSTDFNGGILGADNPTFHATIGWDWIPTMRGRNIGIWDDVYLTTSGKVTIADPLVKTELPLPDTTSAVLMAEVVVKNNDNSEVTGTLSGKIGDVEFSKAVSLKPNQETTVVFDAKEFPQLNVKNPRLWWPNGYGEPYLYDANFTYKIDDVMSDSKDFKVGLRQMTFNEDNDILTLFINGRRFIGRGGNWGFSESNLNYRGREYDIAVAYHADMNFNIIRNWVGMIGDKEFYDACDKYGIMIWQDFWLANPADGPDPYYPEMFIENANDYVKRIRSHASLALYCGRNEGFPPKQIDDALRMIVKTEHSDMHYIPSSADGVVSGHGPYRMLPAKEYFTLKSGNDKFHSERGMPNVMTYESMLRTFSKEGIWPIDNQWGMHDYTKEGAQGCTSFNNIIAIGYGEPQSAKEFSELAQWVNYDGHRSLFESRSNNRRGLLMWMSHPCWPSMVWQTYDYYFEPTAGYFAIKKASQPLHIQWNPATDNVEVVNYSAGSRKGLKAKVQVINMDMSMAWEKEVNVDSEEDTTNKCIKIEFPENLSKVHFIKMTLMEGDRLISDNLYKRTLEENNYQDLKNLEKVKLKVSSGYENNGDEFIAKVEIENTSKTPALLIRVNVVGEKDKTQFLPIFYSDNYFSLLPGEKKTVDIKWNKKDTRGELPKFLVSGYNVVPTK